METKGGIEVFSFTLEEKSKHFPRKSEESLKRRGFGWLAVIISWNSRKHSFMGHQITDLFFGGLKFRLVSWSSNEFPVLPNARYSPCLGRSPCEQGSMFYETTVVQFKFTKFFADLLSFLLSLLGGEGWHRFKKSRTTYRPVILNDVSVGCLGIPSFIGSLLLAFPILRKLLDLHTYS